MRHEQAHSVTPERCHHSSRFLPGVRLQQLIRILQVLTVGEERRRYIRKLPAQTSLIRVKCGDRRPPEERRCRESCPARRPHMQRLQDHEPVAQVPRLAGFGCPWVGSSWRGHRTRKGAAAIREPSPRMVAVRRSFVRDPRRCDAHVCEAVRAEARSRPLLRARISACYQISIKYISTTIMVSGGNRWLGIR